MERYEFCHKQRFGVAAGSPGCPTSDLERYSDVWELPVVVACVAASIVRLCVLVQLQRCATRVFGASLGGRVGGGGGGGMGGGVGGQRRGLLGGGWELWHAPEDLRPELAKPTAASLLAAIPELIAGSHLQASLSLPFPPIFHAPVLIYHPILSCQFHNCS